MCRLFVVLITWLVAISLQAQDSLWIESFKKAFGVANEKKGKEYFKGQFLKGRRNGMGYLMLKDNSVYVGDFYRDEMSGFGILMTPMQMTDCADCFAYVGNWKDGMKSGYGVCYNAQGAMIYRGQFAEDKPTGEYPSNANTTTGKRFERMATAAGDMFIGEVRDSLPNGFGVIFFDNGDLWQSSFKDGKPKGIGLYLASNGEWETVNVVGDEMTVVSSSESYKSTDAVRKQTLRMIFSDFGESLAAATQSAANLVGTINSSSNSNSISSTESGTVTSSVRKQSSGNTKGSGMSLSDSRNYQVLRNTYNKWASDLMQMKNANGRYQGGYSDSDKQHAQDEMKRIRNSAIQKYGKEIPYNPIEDW